MISSCWRDRLSSEVVASPRGSFHRFLQQRLLVWGRGDAEELVTLVASQSCPPMMPRAMRGERDREANATTTARLDRELSTARYPPTMRLHSK